MPATPRPVLPLVHRHRLRLAPRFVVAMLLALALVGIGSVGAGTSSARAASSPALTGKDTPRYEGTYRVHEDGSITMTEVQTVPDDDDCPSQEALDNEVSGMDDPPKSIKAIDRNGRCGYTATWKTVPMSDLKTASGLLADVFTSVKRDGSELDLTIHNKLLNDPSNTTVSWTFVFPAGVDVAQGGKIDGNRATWQDMRHAPKDIHIVGHLKKDFPWLAVTLVVVGAVVVIAVVIILILVLRRKKRRTGPPQNGTQQPGFQPSWPQQSGAQQSGQWTPPGQPGQPIQPGQLGQGGWPTQPSPPAQTPLPPQAPQQQPPQQAPQSPQAPQQPPQPPQVNPGQQSPWQSPPPQP